VLEAENGQRAIELAQGGIDLALLDYKQLDPLPHREIQPHTLTP
jgi:hypothetical protein